MCNGQLLAIAQNQALFSLLGTTYGGNGSTNFALPDLRGRAAMHMGNGFTEGQTAGQTAHTLTLSEMPQHNHIVFASSDGPNSGTPASCFFASGTGGSPYNTTISATMSPDAISMVGGNQPHENMAPYLVLNFCIALQGIFPSQN